MTGISPKILKEKWVEFYETEKQMLAWFKDHAFIVKDFDDEPFGYIEYETKVGPLLERPPKFIRKIVSFSDSNWVKAKEWLSDLEYAYADAIRAHRELSSLSVDDDISYPERFPVFMEPTITQINFSIIPAYQSVRVPLEGDVLLLYLAMILEGDIDAMHQKLKALKLHFDSARLDIDNKNETIELTIDAVEFHQYAQATKIQRRHQTGNSYRARFFDDNGLVRHGALGFLIVHPEQSLDIFASTPRKKRTDSLPDSAIIEMPIELPHTYYRKS